ncbi:MAG: hypothetical protein ACRENG_24170 [bacterium]
MRRWIYRADKSKNDFVIVLSIPEKTLQKNVCFCMFKKSRTSGDQSMISSTVSKAAQPFETALKINEDEAITEANGFILEHLPDRFCAGIPRLLSFTARTIWATPILLSYPEIGPIGEVGFVAVDAELGNVVGWTPFAEIYKAAEKFYSDKREQIAAAFS